MQGSAENSLQINKVTKATKVSLAQLCNARGGVVCIMRKDINGLQQNILHSGTAGTGDTAGGAAKSLTNQ